ncbi:MULTISPECIES: Mur ligase family protein [Pseudomonas]|uniref:Mur ligase family protein n=1 Tax=Pseudomonas guariconensis TaxID=1288410 RepID=UPI002096FFD6|nr:MULTISPECIES: Mur ligase family protein [Pseudomonas]MCO7597221.1 Mur ligase family protein [Pseudomonas guariconensis]MCU7222131.1 Mur ligase family protein [Pseudomonas brassicacearum]
MSLKQQLTACYDFLKRQTAALIADAPPACTLFFSLSDSSQRAKVFHVTADSFETAWSQALSKFPALQASPGQGQPSGPLWLRVERAVNLTTLTWAQLQERLKRHKRNYFRYGIAFDQGLEIALTEQEINANAILYGGSSIPCASFNLGNFSVYVKKRFAGSPALAAARYAQAHPEAPVYLFQTQGVFCAEDGIAHALNSNGPDVGRRKTGMLDAGQVRESIVTAAGFLSRQVKDSGQFVYGYFPCFDRTIQNYNTLRHASTAYSMVEAWALTQDDTLGASIGRALDHLTQTLIKPYTLPDGSAAAFLVDTGDEIKLGGNAVCLLALVKYSEVTGNRDYQPLLEALANGIAWMQDPQTGSFDHVLHARDLSVKEPFRIIYYDGEAAFGLMRLYGLTGDKRWLQVVEKAFDHFIAKEHWRAHDHWLSYCVNELTHYRPEEKYFRFGLNNFIDYLDFVQQRITTFPTLLELMMAAQQMLQRLEQLPALRHLLEEVDLQAFYRALHHRAGHLLNGYFWPEIAMFFGNPARIVGSFFIRHHAFRVRIDDVEHYLSGLIAYHRYLLDGAPQVHCALAQKQHGTGGWHWDAANVVQATGGTWVVAPAADWQASGLAPSMSYFKPQRMLVRHPGKVGVNETRLARLWAKAAPHLRPSAFVCVDPTPYLDAGLPVLQVPDTADAMLHLGRYARRTFSGQVFGVTGSAGKTTVVAMLTHALQQLDTVAQTEGNANLPHGIAWNLACMTDPARFWVLEMAVGRMPINSDLVRPHIAVVTSLAPAHLEYHGTLANLALKKSAIFRSMAPGGHAVLNRDMPHYQVFADAAKRAQLSELSYGEHTHADLRVIDCHATASHLLVNASLRGTPLRFTLRTRGRHMVLNALAVLASLIAAGLPIEQAQAALETFEAVDGRGNTLTIPCGDGDYQLINDAYNANPGSMGASLRMLAELPGRANQRVAVLGDMLELGPESQRYHLDLAEHLLAAAPRHTLLCGPLMHALYVQVRDRLSIEWFEDVNALLDKLPEHAERWFHKGDWVLVKSSGGTGLSQLVDSLTHAQQRVAAL